MPLDYVPRSIDHINADIQLLEGAYDKAQDIGSKIAVDGWSDELLALLVFLRNQQELRVCNSELSQYFYKSLLSSMAIRSIQKLKQPRQPYIDLYTYITLYVQ